MTWLTAMIHTKRTKTRESPSSISTTSSGDAPSWQPLGNRSRRAVSTTQKSDYSDESSDESVAPVHRSHTRKHPKSAAARAAGKESTAASSDDDAANSHKPPHSNKQRSTPSKYHAGRIHRMIVARTHPNRKKTYR